MIRSTSFLTPNEVRWYSDVKLNQCAVTFRNIADIEQFVIERCFSPEFYQLLISNQIPQLTDAPIFDEDQTYNIGQVIRVPISDEPFQEYYELTSPIVPPNPAPPSSEWTLLPGYAFPSALIPAWSQSTTYLAGQRVNYNGRYFEALKGNVAIHPNDATVWRPMPKFYDPDIEAFWCEYMVHWLAYNVWFHKIPFIRGQQESATIQFRFVDYQIAQESIQSMRQEIQNHLYMIWTNMKSAFPNYFENWEEYAGDGCSDPTGTDCGDEALRKYAFRVA